jgi:hypothetical protein
MAVRSPIKRGLERTRVTPGRGLSVSSKTVPIMAPVSLDCEKPNDEKMKRIIETKVRILHIIMITPVMFQNSQIFLI